MDWKTVKKIDAHVHLVPPETLEWIDGVWKQADPTVYLELMEKYHVEKALLVPINEGGNLLSGLQPDKSVAWQHGGSFRWEIYCFCRCSSYGWLLL